MGSYEGKKGRARIDAFNALSQVMGDSPTIAAARTLEKRLLGDKHFAAIAAECARVSQSGILKVWEAVKDLTHAPRLSDKRMHHFLAYFVPSADDPQLYQTHVNYVHAACNNVHLAERPLPVFIESQHIEERYLDRVASFVQNPETLIPFEKEKFIGTVIVGATMAMVLNQVYKGRPDALLPVFVPDTLGAYLGYALMFGDVSDRLYATQKVTAHHDQMGGRHHFSISGDFEGNTRRPPPEALSDVQGSIRLRTFIGLPQMNANQKVLHKAFLPLIDQASQADFVIDFIVDYARGMLGCPNNFTPRFQALFNGCFSIMASDEYKQEIALAMPSLREYVSRFDEPKP